MELKLICHDKWTGLLQHITVSPLQHDLQSESEASSLCTRILSDLIMAWLKEEYKMNVLCSLLSKKKNKSTAGFLCAEDQTLRKIRVSSRKGTRVSTVEVSAARRN